VDRRRIGRAEGDGTIVRRLVAGLAERRKFESPTDRRALLSLGLGKNIREHRDRLTGLEHSLFCRWRARACVGAGAAAPTPDRRRPPGPDECFPLVLPE